MTTKITAYTCDHCGRVYKHRSSANKHEAHCWDNPNRCPREGELHGLAHKGDRDGKPRPWEPDGYGLIYLSGKWVKVRGYQARVACSLYGDTGCVCWRMSDNDCGDRETWPYGVEGESREWRREWLRTARTGPRRVVTGPCGRGL